MVSWFESKSRSMKIFKKILPHILAFPVAVLRAALWEDGSDDWNISPSKKKYICGDKKYILQDQVIYLPVSLKNLPEEIKVQGETLYFPTPFHISLVYVRKIIENYNISIPDFSNKIANDFCDFIT